MVVKKKTPQKSGKKSIKARENKASRNQDSKGRHISRFHGNDGGELPDIGFDFSDHPSPVHLNPETREEREKRLAARKALTLRAFQITYENRRRKTP
jgi:hypothetical protein